MTDPLDPMDGPPTRPDIPEPALRRRRSSQSVRAVVCVQCTELKRRRLADKATIDGLRAERARDAELLSMMRARAERAEAERDALRESRYG